jgi:GT2 family glycosyltransferase
MDLSVVVCTRNRVNKLKRCIDALLSVTTPRDCELVIVDNDSTDGTSEYLESIDQKQFNRIYVKTQFEPKRGASAGKNKGWRTSNGGIVAFTDDDCYVSKDYVDSIVQVFDDDPRIGFLAGRILLFDSLDYPITINESEHRCEFRPWTFIAAGTVQGANMAFRRIVLERIGGFDERLGAGTLFSGDDINAAAAALWSGVVGVYDPRPLVYHHHGRRTEDEARELMRSYDVGRGAYYAKFILSRSSRAEYVKAWIKSIGKDCLGTLQRGRLPRKSIYELSGALQFAYRQAASCRPS